MHHPIDRTTHITAFGTPVVEHWLEEEIGRYTEFLLELLLLKSFSFRIYLGVELIWIIFDVLPP